MSDELSTIPRQKNSRRLGTHGYEEIVEARNLLKARILTVRTHRWEIEHGFSVDGGFAFFGPVLATTAFFATMFCRRPAAVALLRLWCSSSAWRFIWGFCSCDSFGVSRVDTHLGRPLPTDARTDLGVQSAFSPSGRFGVVFVVIPVIAHHPKILLCFLLVLSSNCRGETWETKGGEIAYASNIVVSDGATATLEVRCRPRKEVTLTHPALAQMPTERNGRLDWHQGALVYDGWGLDLTRPDDSGHLGVWVRCPHRGDCIHPRREETDWIVEQLRTQWSWFVRIQPPGSDSVDLRISLNGSAGAIDALCRPSGDLAYRQSEPSHVF